MPMNQDFTDPSFIKWTKGVSIGDRIRWLIEARKLKQTEIAEKMGISQAAISNWITGSSRKPSAPSLVRLADVLGSNPTWIIYGEGTPFTQKPPAVIIQGRNQRKTAQGGMSTSELKHVNTSLPTNSLLPTSSRESKQKPISSGMEKRLLASFRLMDPDAKVALLAVATALAEKN